MCMYIFMNYVFMYICMNECLYVYMYAGMYEVSIIDI